MRLLTVLFLCANLMNAIAVNGDETDSQSAQRIDIGATVKEISFTDIRYLPRSLSEFGERKAFVLVFTTLDCPIVRRSLPTLRRLDEEFRIQGVQFVGINVGPLDSLVDVAGQAVKADLGFPVGKDFTGGVVRALGIRRTPECVVLDAAMQLRYRGRIDSAFRLTGVQSNPGREDLREAIEDVVAGRDVRVAATPVDGCLITEVRKPQSRNLNYYEHVAPLMTRHCQSCHQPDSAGPFSLLTLDDVNSHAAMIAEVVTQRRMPPWHAASEYGHFVNDPGLSTEEINTIVDWASGDRIAGDSSLAPPLLKARESDWLIGEPDLVVQIPVAIEVPAEGVVPYQYALLPYVFLKDTWVQKIEINPGNDAVVHHCNMGFAKLTDLRREEFHPERNFITGYVPGGDPMVLDSGIGFCIPAGSVVGLQLHYVANGEATTDQTSVGFVFAKERIQKQIQHFQCHTSRFAIPPGDGHHKVAASREFRFDATGIGMYCHMHVRGKDMRFEATQPDGRQETLLLVPNYNFEWQSSYRWPDNAQKFMEGTRIDCVAHFDNSSFNPFNPDPQATVRHGLQTYEEMMFGFLFFTRDDEALNLAIDPETGHVIEN